MEIINQFKNHLLNQKVVPSNITVKNYLSDIRKFIFWYEDKYKKQFDPKLINYFVLEEFKTEKSSSINSLERYLSSLRKFFNFLVEIQTIESNPFNIVKQTTATKEADLWHLKEFRNYLYTINASPLTIKNYIIDIKQFLSWAETVAGIKETWEVSEKNIICSINTQLIEEYKRRLLAHGRFSPLSINRKLSSIRKYVNWLLINNYIENRLDIKIGNVILPGKKFSSASELLELKKSLNEKDLISTTVSNNITDFQKSYSKIPPVRLIQKASNLTNLILDSVVTIPLTKVIGKGQYSLWKIKGKPVFKKIPNIKYQISNTGSKIKNPEFGIGNYSKEFYAPHKLSTKYFPFHKKIWFNLRHNRPQWYLKYHSYSVAHYFHFAVLIVFTSAIGFAIYKDFIENPAKNNSLAQVSFVRPRILSFQGKLADSANNPVIGTRSIRFAIHNHPYSKESRLWEETNNVEFDNDGNFTVYLGKNKLLSQDIFSQNPSLYLGIAIGNGQELVPRQMLPTTTFSENSENLAGMLPITNSSVTTNKNTILALNSNGVLSIGGTDATVFQTMDGEFKLTGKSLTLETNTGTNSNIILHPDGTGIIDIQKPIQNTTNDVSLSGIEGAVEINDILSVLATTSTQSAFYINQIGTGPIISAFSNGFAKFSISNSGTGYFADKLGIGTETPVATLDVNGNLKVRDHATFSATLSVGYENYINSTGSAIFSGSVGIGTASPSATLDIKGDLNLSGYATSSGSLNVGFSKVPSGSGNAVFSGNVGIGTDSPSYKLQVGNPGDGSEARANSWNSLSDVRLKENITTLSGALNKVLALSGVSFNWKNTGAKSIGFIAQDVEKVVPEIISTGSDGYKSLDYSKITPLLVEAFKENDSKLQNLSTTINSISINESGNLDTNLIIGKDEEPGKTHTYYLKNNQTGSFINSIGTFGLAFIANLKTGIITAASVSTNSISVATDNVLIAGGSLEDYILKTINKSEIFQKSQIVSPIVQPDKIYTNLLSPISKDTDFVIRLASESSELNKSKMIIQNASNSAVAVIDSSGNASFSGQLTAASATIAGVLTSSEIDITDNATIAGILRAKKIIAEELDLPENKKLTELEQKVASLAGNLDQEDKKTSSAISDDILSISNQVNLASFSGQLTNIDNLNVNFGKFAEGLIALAPASLSDVSINGRLIVGQPTGGLVLADNSINVLGADIELQPFRQGGISIMGGLVSIDTKGNLKVSENAEFEKDVNIKGVLSANVIAPVPNSDLVIQLGHKTNQNHTQNNTESDFSAAQRSSALVVRDFSNSAIARIDSEGNFEASGAGQFKDILAKTFNVVRGAQADTSFTETIATSSAGTATIITGETERTIVSPYIKKDSLIYITPVSDTQGVIPYIARQTAEDPDIGEKGSVTIQIPQRAYKDITVNWWIIN